MGHGLMENRHGLLVDACLTLADGHAERVAALHMIEPRADRPRPDHAGRRQGLRRGGLRQRAALDERDAARGAEHQRPTFGDRRPHDAAWRLCRQPAHPQAHRGGLRLDQDGRRAGQDPASAAVDRVGWAFTFAAAAYNLVRLPKLLAGAGMTASADCPLIGRWRIVEADLWDRDYLDLCGPAAITIGAGNRGEIAFGAMQATSISATAPRWSSSHGPDSTKWTMSPATAHAELTRRRHHRNHLRLPQRRRGHPQGQTRHFFNSLLEADQVELSVLSY